MRHGLKGNRATWKAQAMRAYLRFRQRREPTVGWKIEKQDGHGATFTTDEGGSQFTAWGWLREWAETCPTCEEPGARTVEEAARGHHCRGCTAQMEA